MFFFKSEVLKRYEGDSQYRIDDDGGVHYRGVWGIFRGIWRLGDEIIAAHLGDIIENLPFEELPHWAANNINPLSTSEVAKYRQIQPIPKLINDLISQLESFNYRKSIFLKKNGIVDKEPIIKNLNVNMESQIFSLKKVFTCNTTKEEFLQRTLLLYKLIIDNLNLSLLTKIIDFYNPQYKFDEQGNSLGSLKLFLVCKKLMIIDEAVNQSGIAGDFHSNVNKYFDLLRQSMVDPSGDFLLAKIKENFEKLEQNFAVLFTVYAFRSKSGAAHPGSETEFIRALKSLEFEENQTEYLPVYRKLIEKLSKFFLNT